jgi:hypothetical protein
MVHTVLLCRLHQRVDVVGRRFRAHGAAWAENETAVGRQDGNRFLAGVLHFLGCARRDRARVDGAQQAGLAPGGVLGFLRLGLVIDLQYLRAGSPMDVEWAPLSIKAKA